MFDKKIKIEIKSWLNGSVLFEYEAKDNTIAKTIAKAIEKKADLSSADLSSADLRSANLRYADLSSADLRSANLRYADLRSADLSYADLRSANLRYADLRSANLRSADLRSADLRSANLRSADLRSADLSSADLRSADLRYADLRSADLRSADLRSAKNFMESIGWVNLCSRDILFILEHLKPEVPYLREKLIKGEVDGTQYEGECACLIGSLGKADGGTDEVCKRIPFYEKGLENYGEQFFWNIKKGDTPENSEFAKHALVLIDMVLKS